MEKETQADRPVSQEWRAAPGDVPAARRADALPFLLILLLVLLSPLVYDVVRWLRVR